jgi:HlyD family secretion protein
MKKIALRLVIVLAVAGAAWGGYTLLKEIPQTTRQETPTAKVRKGDVIVRTYARGELRAVRSATLTAPNLFGTVQVTKLAALGSFAREKDLVVEFDDSELLSRIEEKQLEIDQVDEQIKKAQADLAIRDNQDQVELLRTRYMVRRAELEVQRNELLSAIDAKKNELNLEEAKRRLAQLESDIKSRREQAQAELAVLRERRNKAVLEMQRERSRLTQVKLLAPMSGLVAIRQMRSGFFFSGVSLPDIREGDQLQPGMPVVDILDLSELEVISRIGELDRANLTEGQDVVIKLDALADTPLRGKVKSMSGTASANVFSNDPQKKFDVVFSIDMHQLLSALGASKEQIARVMAQAEANRRRAPAGGPAPGAPFEIAAAMPAAGGALGGGMAGPAGPMLQFRRGGEGGGAGGAGGSGQGLSDEQRQKMREAMQNALGGKNMQDLSDEERREVFRKVQESLRAQGITLPGRQGGDRGERKGGESTGEAAGAGRRMARGEGGGFEGAAMMFGGGQRFSAEDLANAKLPPPPEDDSQLEVLLRPGLLADVEIIVEKIPDAIHIPAQALFEKDGKMLAYVRQPNGKFEPRVVKPLKRSENMMVIESGLQEGEEVALVDPEAAPASKKKRDRPGEAGGGNMALPGGRKGAE